MKIGAKFDEQVLKYTRSILGSFETSQFCSYQTTKHFDFQICEILQFVVCSSDEALNFVVFTGRAFVEIFRLARNGSGRRGDQQCPRKTTSRSYGQGRTERLVCSLQTTNYKRVYVARVLCGIYLRNPIRKMAYTFKNFPLRGPFT